MENLVVNRGISYLDRGGVCVVYLNYHFFFFRGKAREYLLQITQVAEVTEKIKNRVPEDFLKFLMSIKLLVRKLRVVAHE